MFKEKGMKKLGTLAVGRSGEVLCRASAALQEMGWSEDAQAEDMRASCGDLVMVSFGGPTPSECSKGFWKTPKSIPGSGGASMELLDPSQGWVKENIGLKGAWGDVIDVTHAPGPNGGYVGVTLVLG